MWFMLVKFSLSNRDRAGGSSHLLEALRAKPACFPGKKFCFEVSARAWVSSTSACPTDFRPACPHDYSSQFLKINGHARVCVLPSLSPTGSVSLEDLADTAFYLHSRMSLSED